MRIGFDLDSTLIYWLINPVKQAAINLNLKEYSRQHDFEYSNLNEEHRQEIFKLFGNPDYMGPQNVIYDIKDKAALKFWKSKGHRLYLITARKPEVVDTTKLIIENYFKNIFYKVIICHKTECKEEYFVNERLDVWVDDSPKGISISMELGIKTFMIYNKITSMYNNDTLIKYIGNKNFKNIRSVYEIWKGKMI